MKNCVFSNVLAAGASRFRGHGPPACAGGRARGARAPRRGMAGCERGLICDAIEQLKLVHELGVLIVLKPVAAIALLLLLQEARHPSNIANDRSLARRCRAGSR